MARHLRDEQAAPGQKQGRECEPVRGRSAKSVHEHERIALAGNQEAQPTAAHFCKAFLELG